MSSTISHGLFTILGALIAVFASYGLESLRGNRRNNQRRKAVARTVASEIHSHKTFIEALLNRKSTLKEMHYKLIDSQWQQYQNELWELDPSLGILFRQYYDALGEIKSESFSLSTDLEKKFAPLLKLSRECLSRADFPLRVGGSEATVNIGAEG